MQRITPFLWFDGKAEEAANFYVSIFKNSRLGNIARYGDQDQDPQKSQRVMAALLKMKKLDVNILKQAYAR